MKFCGVTRNFIVPFDYHIHKKLQQLIDNNNKINEMLIPHADSSIKRSQLLDCNKKEFSKYQDMLEKASLDIEQKHNFIYKRYYIICTLTILEL